MNNIEDVYEIFKQYPIVSTDTRNCIKDSIFFALKGKAFNGNEYASKALDLGCSYAIVDEAKYATHPKTILVENVLTTLQGLANHHRRKMKTPVLAITGTNGKTTTKELVTSVLSKEHNVLATEGNFNNHIGVPLSLLRLKKEHDIAVIEMGANHVGEIHDLCEIVEPNFGLITNIGHAHLEGFGSFENIIKTKGELYNYIRSRKDGKLFVDYDNKLLRELSENITSIYYGQTGDNFVIGRVLSVSPYLEFEWKFMSHKETIKTHLVGDYNLSNALAAIAIGKYFGVKGELISKAIAEYIPENNRSQLKRTENNMVIIDAYNANPTSMRAALENFDRMELNRKVLIIGDMNELGPDSSTEHQAIADSIAAHKFEEVFFVGPNFSKVRTSNICFPDVDALKTHLTKNPLKDSYILVKGSRGIQLEKCIELL